MAKRGFRPLKGVEEGGGEGKESHTHITTRGLMSHRSKMQHKSFLAVAPLRTPLGEFVTLPHAP